MNGLKIGVRKAARQRTPWTKLGLLQFRDNTISTLNCSELVIENDDDDGEDNDNEWCEILDFNCVYYLNNFY